MITQPLAEHATAPHRERTPAIISKDEKQRANKLLWGFIIMFIGVTLGLIGKKIMHEEIVTVIGVLVSLIGMFLTAYPYLAPSPHKKYDSSPSSQPELTQSQPTEYLPQGNNIEYVPSITERTTDLLKDSAATSTRQKSGS